MTTLMARPYAGAADLPALIDFAQRTTASRLPQASYYHPGDFVWQLYSVGRSKDVRLWAHDGGSIAACAIFEPPLTFEFVVAPEVDRDRVTREILRWADERRSIANNKDDVPRAYQPRGTHTLSTSAYESDAARIALLLEDGYVQLEGVAFRLSRSLDSVDGPLLPDGAAFRTMTDDDAPRRAELHRDAWSVWGESKHTTERYQQLRNSPLYDPDLDVVLAVDGKLASYCVCWLDTANRIGLFEPVGTRPSMTRRGFGRMVLHEAFRRLRDKGMRSAVISTGTMNPAAMALYFSAGFETIERAYTYVKRDASRP